MNARKEDCYDGPPDEDRRTAERMAWYPPPDVDLRAYYGIPPDED